MVEDVDVATMSSDIEHLANVIAINFGYTSTFRGSMHCAVSCTIYIQPLIK
jgi:hypothetical protein